MRYDPEVWRNLSNGIITGSHVRLKKACDGGNESRIMEEEWAVETLIRESSLAAVRAAWMYVMAETKTGAAFGMVVRTSEPTDMAVMLVAGTWGRMLRVTQLAAVELDWPIASSCWFGTETVTRIPLPARAVSIAESAS